MMIDKIMQECYLQSMTALGVEVKDESQVAITLNKLRTILEKHLEAVEEVLKGCKCNCYAMCDEECASAKALTILNGEGK